ncbi:Kinesin light chain, putative [Penicillium digitatum PHI26]|uniref:Kinesin light chain, putative n=1 Tax=Penicillium digitatum (strain PHI26 / CECT 20796) TaxID=1170229 RepID=K9G6M8_PEND2|nr:Kinesin light chain, putative [Penicillium digitatum PHI26]
MHRQALKGYKKALRLQHPNTLSSISHLGSILEQQDLYKKAEAMYHQALKNREKTLGLQHPDTLTSINNLDSMLKQQGLYEEAKAMHRRALKNKEKTLGPKHPDILANKQRITLNPNQPKSRNPTQIFLKNHPLFRSFLDTSPLPPHYNLNEID